MYGPKSDSLKASIPGAPPPPPGLPIFPVPPGAEPLESCPPPPPADGDSEGRGAYVPELEGLPLVPEDFGAPAVDEPPTGPVDKVFPTGAPLGAGTVNGVDGLATGAGVDTGLALGLAVGGAGFA